MTPHDRVTPDGKLPIVDAVMEWLLDAAVRGEFETTVQTAQQHIEHTREQLEPEEYVRCQFGIFDLSLVSTNRLELQQTCGENLLLAALDLDDAFDWNTFRQSGRLQELERLASENDAGMDLIELLVYAPDSGIHEFAVNRLISAGLRNIEIGLDSRPYERLLHATGATAEAYRLETLRKQRIRSDVREWTETPAPRYRVLAIAGGHPQMRVSATILLARYGISVVTIPSSQEAVRRERDVMQALQGCDAVVLIVRQITHSTSDQIRKSAGRLNIPVIFSHAVSALAIERELFPPDRT